MTAAPHATENQTVDPAQLKRQMPRIAGIAAELGEAMAQVDQSFVQVSGELAGSASRLSTVTAAFEELPRELESAEIVEATDMLGEVVRHTREIMVGFDAEQRDLDALVEKVDGAHTPMASLRKTIRMIDIVSINARVVASSISSTDHELVVFTTDIAVLAGKAEETIKQFFNAYERLSSDLHKAMTERDRFQARQRTDLNEIATRLSGNLDEITERRRRSIENSVETGRVTREISARIGQAVMSLQIGDATRQRIEHACDGLNDINLLIAGDPSLGIGLTDDQRVESAAHGLDLISRLLEGARGDFNSGASEAEQSVKALVGNANTLMRHSREVYGQKHSQGTSVLSELNANMREVAGILEECETDRSKLDAAALAVGQMVDELLSYVEAVQEIEASMRLVTLNAAVECAHLGPDGKALDVIAKQLRELTGETVTSARSALRVLTEAAELARGIAGSAQAEGSQEIARLRGAESAAIALFEKSDAHLSAALKVLHEQEHHCETEILDAAERFSRYEEVSETLADASLRIAALRAEIGVPEPGEGDTSFSEDKLLQRFRASYSMESERRVHDAFIGAKAADAPPESAVFEEDEDDLGLF